MNILTAINILAGSIGRPDTISARVERVISIHPCAKICTHDAHSDEAKKQFDEIGEKSILKRESLFTNWLHSELVDIAKDKARHAKVCRDEKALAAAKAWPPRKTLVTPPRGRRASKATSLLPAVAKAAAGLSKKKQ